MYCHVSINLHTKKLGLIFKIEIIFFIHFILHCFLGNQAGVKNPELKAQLPSSFAIIFPATKNKKQL